MTQECEFLVLSLLTPLTLSLGERDSVRGSKEM
jgi:hypothetical protein